MRITVSGLPGTEHYSVSKSLADRFNIKLISAKDIADRLFDNNPHAMHEFSIHMNNELDEQVNKELFSLIRSTDEFVADGLLTHLFATNSINVFIHQEYTDSELFAEARKRDFDTDSRICSKLMVDRYDDHVNYNIYLMGTGLTVEQKVDAIIETIRLGRNCVVTTPRSVLPMSMTTPMDLRSYVPEPVFTGRFSGDFLLVSNNILTQFSKLNRDSIIYIDVEKSTNGVIYEVSNPLYYEKWFQHFLFENTGMLVKVMLYYYCKDKRITNMYEEFVRLSKNGSVLKTLISLGYLK